MMKHTLHKLPLLGSFAVRPRLALAVIFGVALYFILPVQGSDNCRMILSWDFATGFYLVAAAVMMGQADEANMRKNAAVQDENGGVILALTIIGATVSLSAIMHELATAKSLTGHAEVGAIALAAATVFLTWLFMQVIFALHYAHAYYSPATGRPDRGLEFPAKYTSPDYWDFAYFSIVIGAAAATADINITSREIRRVATLQSIIAFFFNAAILALAINIGAGLV